MSENGRKKPSKKMLEAAALSYQTGRDKAPVVTAMGRGLVAERILAQAVEHKVPVVSDTLLVQALNKLDVGDEIPKEFYGIVAQILVTVSRMDREYGAELERLRKR